MTYAVYMITEGACGFDEMIVQGGFATETEAEEYMTQLIADDMEEYGEQVDEMYVGEEY